MTPWDFSPIWFVLFSIVLPVVLWTALAWKRALDEDPHRLHRAGSRELRRLLARLKRKGDAPRSVDLHAWFQAAARTWGVNVSTPTESAIDAGWRRLWTSVERRLYAVDSTLPPNWIEDATAVANQVRIPRREHWFPRRLRHWLPSVAAGMCACTILAGSLWAAEVSHYDIGVQQMALGNVDYAVAHFTAAFLQNPASAEVQNNLRSSLQQASIMDPTLRRLLYGAWFQRYPAFLSPASWQRLGLFAAMLIGAGLCALVLSIYTSLREHGLKLTGRWAVTVGIALLAVSVMSWNAWGDFHRPNVAMLVEGINLSPAPTDLVKDRETLPMTAGSLTLFQGAFLGWKHVELRGLPGGKVTGWVRARYVMPLYANAPDASVP